MWRSIVAVCVVALLATFIVQNREVLELRFLLWTFETRRAYLLVVVFGMGAALGWIAGTISQLAARGRDAALHTVNPEP